MLTRSSGILLHPSSLPGKYGIGALGKEAFAFVDFLKKAGQTWWQILPLGPTGYGDSPYQCFSSKAGNPYLIDMELLVEKGLLQQSDLDDAPAFDDAKVQYGEVIDWKLALLRKSETYFREQEQGDFDIFLSANAHWIHDYALFMALKEKFDKRPWYEWEEKWKNRDAHTLETERETLKEEIHFQQYIQFLFFEQWFALKKYANANGVQIIGDIPIYVAMDSVDSWSNPELFLFNANREPLFVGGCPPDYFSETGQLWGNPIFNYARMQQDGFQWWIDRMRSNLTLYDLIRVDHFRGFAGYWSIPYGEVTAINGTWETGPGKALFEAILHALGDIPIIAEDLGLITPDVIELRDHFQLPGMKILQFAFDSAEDNDYLPHTYNKNCVVYTGTHDNDTVVGWFASAKESDQQYVLDYLHSDVKDIAWDFIRAAWSSVAALAMAPMQDVLGLDGSARMNLPGTTKDNWLWRMPADVLQDDALAEKLYHLTMLYGRL